MKISAKGISIIKRFEGLVLHPYLDAVSAPTVGFGTTHYPSGKAVTMKDKPITKQQAEEYLQYEVDAKSYVLNQSLAKFGIKLNQNQYDAISSFVYNVGIYGFLSSTMFKKIKVWPGDPTIKGEFDKWVYGTIKGKKVKIEGLISRRKLESDLYFS